jgi:hypothetical protein
MTSDLNRVIVTSGGDGYYSIHTSQIHHRNFPEVFAEGESPLRAADNLILLLDRARDGAPDPWHRQDIEQAIADVWSFIGNRLTTSV